MDYKDIIKQMIADGIISQEVAEKYIHEFKESENERIRKAITEFFKNFSKNGTWKAIPDVTKWIAWLENKGESTDILADAVLDDNNDGLIADTIRYKKQTEQKSEPKFKVGDWIVDNCGYIWKIEGILNQFYLLEGIEGGESRPTIEWVNKTFHLWTVQDAKDGDVLVGGEQLFLFKRMNTSNSFYAHCNYHFIGYDSLSVYDCSYSIDNIYPATKEQRDTLERAMTNAGYRWNKEELKLEKI